MMWAFGVLPSLVRAEVSVFVVRLSCGRNAVSVARAKTRRERFLGRNHFPRIPTQRLEARGYVIVLSPELRPYEIDEPLARGTPPSFTAVGHIHTLHTMVLADCL